METQETLEFKEIIQYRGFVNEKSAMAGQFKRANPHSPRFRGTCPFPREEYSGWLSAMSISAI
jgi:hypothetical protein